MAEARVVKFCVIVGYIKVLAFGQPTVPERGVVMVTSPILEFYTPYNIFGTAKATDFRFYARFGHEKH